MVHDGADVTGPDRVDAVRVRFDEDRLVSDAGLLLTATLAERLGIEEWSTSRCGWATGRPGRRCRAAKS